MNHKFVPRQVLPSKQPTVAPEDTFADTDLSRAIKDALNQANFKNNTASSSFCAQHILYHFDLKSSVVRTITRSSDASSRSCYKVETSVSDAITRACNPLVAEEVSKLSASEPFQLLVPAYKPVTSTKTKYDELEENEDDDSNIFPTAAKQAKVSDTYSMLFGEMKEDNSKSKNGGLFGFSADLPQMYRHDTPADDLQINIEADDDGDRDDWETDDAKDSKPRKKKKVYDELASE